MDRVKDKIALVTGGTRGIGLAISMALAEEGANVALNYLNDNDSANSAVEQIRKLGRTANSFQADTSNSDQVKKMVDDVLDNFGRIDILINNAGVLRRTPFLDISESEWDMILDTNLKGYFLVGQTVSRLMVEQKYGRIVNVSSSSEKLAAINMTHYTVSKAAISMLTRQMAAELAPYGVNVNSVAPGLIETDINRNDLSNPTFREKRLSRIPTGVIGIPSDVSGTVLHLVSDDAKLMNGATVFVDGGSSIWSGRTS